MWSNLLRWKGKKLVVPRLYLLNDSDGCPGKSEAACRQRSYVVKGDVVVLAQHRDGYACAFYPNKVGGSAGWVAERNLQAVSYQSVKAAKSGTILSIEAGVGFATS